MSSLPPLEISTGACAIPQHQTSFSGASTLKPKPESRTLKNLAQELVSEKPVTRKENTSNVKKSNSFRTESKSKSSSPTPSETISGQAKHSTNAVTEANVQVTKSPKISRHESMERTVQRITKVIRGTSRSESRSKKNRETSVSPSKGTSKTEQTSGNLTTASGASGGTSSNTKSTKKDQGKKNAHEKREMFKSLH